jgi:hypothetical protein
MKRFLTTAEKRIILFKYTKMGFSKEKAQEKLDADLQFVKEITSKERKARCVGGVAKKKIVTKEVFLEGLKCKD